MPDAEEEGATGFSDEEEEGVTEFSSKENQNDEKNM